MLSWFLLVMLLIIIAFTGSSAIKIIKELKSGND